MADEIVYNYTPGKTLYACRFQQDGNVFITTGASDEVWGAGGHGAGDYVVAMTETNADNSGHYLADFDASIKIAAGVYRICIYEQLGAITCDGDTQIGQGELYWDGIQEITMYTVDGKINILSINTDKMDENAPSILNIYDDRT